MKKATIALALVALTGLSHAGYISADLDRVKDDKSGKISHAQYFRAGGSVAGFDTGVQVRTAAFDGGGMVNSVEGTLGKNLGPVGLFAGVGHDNGFNGGRSFQYGLVGLSTGAKIGPVWGYAGVKTRVNWDGASPDQTVAFAGVSKALSKQVSVHAGTSKSWGGIKETAFGAGVRVGF